MVTEGAGRLLAADDGPRLAAISYDGWDTHAQEGPGRPDDSAAAGRTGWRLSTSCRTLLATPGRIRWWPVVTEFGRTARANGSDGTDHGTATAALLLGGAVKGGRTIADWPGLRDSDLLDNRDLKPSSIFAPDSGAVARSSGDRGTGAGDARVPGQHRRATARRLDRLNERRPPRRLGHPRPPITFDGSPYSIGETAFHLDDLSHHLGEAVGQAVPDAFGIFGIFLEQSAEQQAVDSEEIAGAFGDRRRRPAGFGDQGGFANERARSIRADETLLRRPTALQYHRASSDDEAGVGQGGLAKDDVVGAIAAMLRAESEKPQLIVAEIVEQGDHAKDGDVDFKAHLVGESPSQFGLRRVFGRAALPRATPLPPILAQIAPAQADALIDQPLTKLLNNRKHRARRRPVRAGSRHLSDFAGTRVGVFDRLDALRSIVFADASPVNVS